MPIFSRLYIFCEMESHSKVSVSATKLAAITVGDYLSQLISLRRRLVLLDQLFAAEYRPKELTDKEMTAYNDKSRATELTLYTTLANIPFESLPSAEFGLGVFELYGNKINDFELFAVVKRQVDHDKWVKKAADYANEESVLAAKITLLERTVRGLIPPNSMIDYTIELGRLLADALLAELIQHLRGAPQSPTAREIRGSERRPTATARQLWF